MFWLGVKVGCRIRPNRIDLNRRDGIDKFVSRYNKRLNLNSDQIEKYLRECLSNVYNKYVFLSLNRFFKILNRKLQPTYITLHSICTVYI